MMNTTVTAIIQARMTSTRLPGKVMMRVLNRPLLAYLIERLASARYVENVVLATTVNQEDNAVAALGQNLGVTVFRGSENNVLGRFYGAATAAAAEHIMRITADCPLIDPDFLDMLIKFYFNGQFDFACNCNFATLPDGLDAEIFTFAALENAHKHARLPSELEHVTPYIRNRPERFKIGNWSYPCNLSRLRWTVDEPEDFELVRQVIEALYPGNRHFRTKDILELFQSRPELVGINAHFGRNEGFLKSIEADRRWLSQMAAEPVKPPHFPTGRLRLNKENKSLTRRTDRFKTQP